MSAIITNDCLTKSENALSNSIEKLSSGYKINHAKDSPSGIAIAKRMNAQIRSMTRAEQNANDGISVTYVSGIRKAKTDEERLFDAVRLYLGSTGLLCRWV